MSPGSTSISASSTTTAVTLKSASRSTFGSRRSTGRSMVSSRSSMASVRRATSVRWSWRVGSASSTYRFCTAGRRITCRPTPTVAALGRVVSGGTSTLRSWVAVARQASRQPAPSSLGENVRRSCREIGVCTSRRTLHLWQVPWPPQVESIAMPFHEAESKTLTPGGTRTSRSWPSVTVKDSCTRPVPSCGSTDAPGGASRPSRATGSSEVASSWASSCGGAVTLRELPLRSGLPEPPGPRGGGRSTPSPIRRGRAAGRSP